MNSDEIRKEEFYLESARWMDTTDIRKVQKCWDAFVETITRELFFRGKCVVPFIGTFYTRHIKEGVHKTHDQEGYEMYYYVPDHDMPAFRPCDSFINDINMQGVTKKFRTRLKQNKLNLRDRQRITKKEAMEILKDMGKTVRAGDRACAIDEFDEIIRLKSNQQEVGSAYESKSE